MKRILICTNYAKDPSLEFTLQVLDFLCGNVDRHAGNLSYQFDSYDSFDGTQGFDNDCAMGALVPTDGKGKNRLVGTRHLMAVSQKTYDRIQQLQPAVLKYALRGYGLSEPELEAAGFYRDGMYYTIWRDL